MIVLASTARILEDGAGRFRIRTGVWNFEEAVIDVSNEPPAVATSVSSALRALADGPIDVSAHLDEQLQPVERANVERLFADLTEAGIVVPPQEGADQHALTAALLGRLVSPYPGADDLTDRKVMFWSDSPIADHQAKQLSDQLGLPLLFLPEAVAGQLASTDLTSRMEGMATEHQIADLREQLTGPVAIVTCFQRPSVPTLRNLNRVLDGQETPWISAFIDGPFVSMVGVKSPLTGCFECFEQRSLARLEDHVSYHEFARAPLSTAPSQAKEAPVMSMLATMALTEGYLHAAVGTSRFSGRALSIHLPTFEIQAQDLLRMPNCPGCGRVARQRIKEVNFSTRAAVDRIVTEVLR